MRGSVLGPPSFFTGLPSIPTTLTFTSTLRHPSLSRPGRTQVTEAHDHLLDMLKPFFGSSTKEISCALEDLSSSLREGTCSGEAQSLHQGLCWSARAAMTKYHRLAGLNNSQLLSLSAEAGSAGSRCPPGWVPPRHLSLTCSRPPSRKVTPLCTCAPRGVCLLLGYRACWVRASP